MGYDGVELAIRDPKLIDNDRLAAVLARYGLEVPVVTTGQAWLEEGLSFTSADAKVREATIERMKSHYPLAARLDAMIMLGLIRGEVAEGVSRAQASDWLVESLEECAVSGARAGVRFVIEPINRYEAVFVHSAREGLELLDQLGYDNLGLALDTYHMNIEEPSIEESIRMTGDRLLHFHVADSNRWYPGAGHIDFPQVVATLRDINYAGFLSGEFMPHPDPETAARKAIEYLRPLLV
jgi:sugar phosphate isomerase/epimerase